MDGRCERHNFEAAVGLCDNCGDEFCSECLVHPFGPKRPPFCIPCTIANSGLRASNAVPKRKKPSRKERKAMAVDGDIPTPAPAPPPLAAVASVVTSSEDGGSKHGRRSKRKDKKSKRKKDAGDEAADAPIPTPVASAGPAFSPIPEPVPADDPEDTAVPAGAAMPAAGAEQIDWSKPFEVTS